MKAAGSRTIASDGVALEQRAVCGLSSRNLAEGELGQKLRGLVGDAHLEAFRLLHGHTSVLTSNSGLPHAGIVGVRVNSLEAGNYWLVTRWLSMDTQKKSTYD